MANIGKYINQDNAQTNFLEVSFQIPEDILKRINELESKEIDVNDPSYLDNLKSLMRDISVGVATKVGSTKIVDAINAIS